MTTFRGRLAVMAMIALGVLTLLHATPAGAAETPTVSINVGPHRRESLLGGACYRGNVDVTQPIGFVVSRTGPVDEPLDVVYSQNVGYSDTGRTLNKATITIPAGSDSVPVPSSPGSEPSVSNAHWSAGIETGVGYEIDAGSDASFDGYIPANPDSMGPRCELKDETRRFELEVGQNVERDNIDFPLYGFTIVSGELPPGLRLDWDGVSGTVARAGSWTFMVDKCPTPNVGDPICGRLTYLFRVLEAGSGAGDETTTSSSSTTPPIDSTSTTDEPTSGTVEVAERASSSGESTGAKAAGVSALVVGVTGLGLVIRKARSTRLS